MRLSPIVVLALLFATPQLAPDSLAAGDGSSTEEPSALPVESDEELYEQGKALAESAKYDEALAVLAKIKNQNVPKVLNYIGYSHRKAGRLEVAIATYQQALALDPDYVQARAYLGEGYIAAGQMDLAKQELAEIKTRCGDSCEEFMQLAKAIEAAGS